jgi:hypothetical protein
MFLATALLLVLSTPDAQPPENGLPQKICKETASLNEFGIIWRVKKVCATRAEWRELQAWNNKRLRDSFPISGR